MRGRADLWGSCGILLFSPVSALSANLDATVALLREVITFEVVAVDLLHFLVVRVLNLYP